MNVNEIFDSIDGEGIYAGQLATFIRLSGCNLRCGYCDTTYAFNCGEELSIDEILSKVKEINNKHITLTGGEPLIHKDVDILIKELCQRNYIVNIETNGSVDVKDFQNENTIITMDYKTISSGENSKMNRERIESLRRYDVLKIVCKESDFDDIKDMIKNTDVKSYIYLSPIYNKIEPIRLVEFLKELRDKRITNRARMQLQLHKLIWRPEERGV